MGSCRERGGPTADKPDIAAFGRFHPLRPLPGGHRNVVWLVEGAQGLFVAKSTRRTEAQLHWLAAPQAAARAAGLVVPASLETDDGRMAPGGWTLEPFVPGPVARPGDLAALAPRIAAFHDRTRHIPQRPGFTALSDLQDQARSGDVNLAGLPHDLRQRLRAAWAHVSDRPLCAIHGDLSAGNIVMTDAGPALLDWDEARVDHAFLDHIALSKPDPTERLAHLALEIAACWSVEPHRAQELLARLAPPA